MDVDINVSAVVNKGDSIIDPSHEFKSFFSDRKIYSYFVHVVLEILRF